MKKQAKRLAGVNILLHIANMVVAVLTSTIQTARIIKEIRRAKK
jgi:hypothetical protein